VIAHICQGAISFRNQEEQYSYHAMADLGWEVKYTSQFFLWFFQENKPYHLALRSHSDPKWDMFGPCVS